MAGIGFICRQRLCISKISYFTQRHGGRLDLRIVLRVDGSKHRLPERAARNRDAVPAHHYRCALAKALRETLAKRDVAYQQVAAHACVVADFKVGNDAA